MKKASLFFVVLLIGYFAQADSNIIKYGRDLCDKVSFRTPTQKACEDWVIDHSDSNPFSVALNVCVGYNEGPSSRVVECFERASQWLTNQDIKDQIELCASRNGNYVPRAECLRGLFTKKNNEVYAAQMAQSKQEQSTRGTTGAVR